MRAVVILFLLLTLGLAPSPALAQSQAVAPAKPAAPAALHAGSTIPTATPAPAPASSAAPAIIPGSPLAALANATSSAEQGGGAVAAPFGTTQIGFILSSALGADAIRAYDHFWDSVYDAMRLTPVTEWLSRVQASPQRLNDARGIVTALLLAVLPAALADGLLRFLLRGAGRRCVLWAQPDAARGPSRWRRRLTFAVLKLLLAVLPIAGFALAAFLLLNGGTTTLPPARLAATGISNAYIVCRLVQELARFLVSPAAPALRLIPMPDGRARALMRWLAMVLATLLVAAGVISSTLVLGLPHAGVAVLARFAGLAIHLEAAFGLWQSRAVVAGWIAGRPDAASNFTWLRRRLARIWHIIAIFYVLALWVAWTAGVQNAFVLLLRSVLVLVAAMVTGAITWKASLTLLEKLLTPATNGTRHATLLARAVVYTPLLGLLIRGIIIAVVGLVVLQGWGVDALHWLHTNPVSAALLSALSSIVVITILAIGLWETVNILIHTRIERLVAAGRQRNATRLRTLAPILRGALGTVIAVVAFLVALSQIGVNTTGLLAVSSIAGIAVGFGSQTLVRDIITGLFMLFEDAIQVGDSVTLAGMSGTVERLSIRTIHLRGSDGSLNIIPFSSVTTITNATRDFSNAEISLTVANDTDFDRMLALLTEIGRELRADGFWQTMIRDDLQIFGLDKFDPRGMVVTGQMRTAPGQHAAVRREFYKRVQQRFTAEGIVIPTQQTMVKLELPPERG